MSGAGTTATADTGELSWREAHAAVVPLMRVDNRTSIAYIAREYAALAVVLAACVPLRAQWKAGHLSPWAFWPAAALGMLVIAALQHRLSGLAHDASHYSLFRNKVANELASDLLLMFPLFAMTQLFRNSHLGHHRFVNDPDLDPDVVRLNRAEPQRFPVPGGRFCLRYLVGALWPPRLIGYLIGQAKGANATVAGGVRPVPAVYSVRVGRLLQGAYWLTLLTIVHALHAWPVFGLFWCVPLLTFYPLLMQLREIAHHSNAPDAGRFTNSRVFEVHPLVAAAVFPYGQAYHVTHHLFAMLPHHQMRRAHELLLRYQEYRDRVVVCRGFFVRRGGGPSVLDVLARTPRPGDLLWDGPPRQRVAGPTA